MGNRLSLSKVKEDEIVRLYERSGLSQKTIATKMKIGSWVVWSVLKRRNIVARSCNKLTMDEEILLCEGYERNKLSTAKLAKIFHIAQPTAYEILKRRGVTFRKKSESTRRYAINESAFDTLTGDAKYWLGFLMADGFVGMLRGQFPYFGLRLANKDIQSIIHLKKFLSSSIPIRKFPNGSSGIAISSAAVCARLAEFGIVVKKSLICKAHESLKLDADFWRGVVDGDGYIGFNKFGTPVLQLCGSKFLMEQFTEWIASIVPGYAPNIHRHGKTIFAVWTAGRFAVRILDGLYRDSTPETRLKRKYETSMIALNYKWKSVNFPSLK